MKGALEYPSYVSMARTYPLFSSREVTQKLEALRNMSLMCILFSVKYGTRSAFSNRTSLFRTTTFPSTVTVLRL